MLKNDFKIFAGSSGKAFAQRMCDYIGLDLGRSESVVFSDGNIMVKIDESVRGKDIYLVQPVALNPNNEFMEILFWVDAFKRASSGSVTVIVPYFSYAKGDRKDDIRASVRARVCADMIETSGADRIVFMDLHTPQILGFFRKPVEQLYAAPILCQYIRNLELDNLVVVSPDAGSIKRARRFASCLGVPVAVGDKVRRGFKEEAEIMDIIGDVKNKTAVILDDFSLSGGTLVEISNGLKRRGAERIIACLSHMLLRSMGLERIEGSPIELLIATDTVENSRGKQSNKIKILSVAPLFAEAVIKMQSNESLTPLLNSIPERIVRQCF